MRNAAGLHVPAVQSISSRVGLIPVIGYVRVSTWREEMISVEIQKSVIDEAAKRRGRYVSVWIVDEDATGRNFKRKIMQGIDLVENENNSLNEIWVWKFSRFGRNRHGIAINLFRIEAVGGQLVSATEDIDPSTATGEFTRDMLFAVASFESNRAGEQWRETHQLRRSMGLPATGGKRFGYRWHPRRLPDNEGGWTLQDEWYEVWAKTAEPALDAYVRYTKQTLAGFGKVAVWWNDLGLLNTRGEPWQDQTVKWYMDSGFAAGMLRSHKADSPGSRCKNKGSCQKADHHEYLPAEHEALLSAEEWDNYRAVRETRRQTPRRCLDPVYPLSGLPKCGICEQHRRTSAASIHHCKGEAGYGYRCGARARHHVNHEPVYIRRWVVEQAVHDELVKMRDELDAIVSGRIVVPAPRKDPTHATKRKRIEADIAKYTGALDRATDGLVLGRISNEQYERVRDKFTGLKEEAEQRLVELGPETPAPQVGPVDHRETVVGLLEEWDTISVASKRRMLATLIRRVEIYPEDVVKVVPVWAPPDPPRAAKASAARRALS